MTKAKKFYIYRVCSKGEMLMSSRRIRTAQGEINWFSYLNKRKRFSGFQEPWFGVQMPLGAHDKRQWKSRMKLSFSLSWLSCFTREPDRRCTPGRKNFSNKEGLGKRICSEGMERKKPVQETTKFRWAGDYFALIQATEMFDPLYNRKALKRSVLQGKSTK